MTKRRGIACAVATVAATLVGCGEHPDPQPPPQSTVRGLSVTTGLSCAVTTDGALRCWGDLASRLVVEQPREGPFAAVRLSRQFACGLTDGGSVDCWGADWVDTAGFPTDLASISVAGFPVFCGTTSDHQAKCWLMEEYWRSAPGAPDLKEQEREWADELVAGAPVGVVARIETRGLQACALSLDGAFRCWGSQYESFGRGAPEEDVLDFSIDGSVGCAILSGNIPKCWGLAADAELPPGRFDRVFAQGGTICLREVESHHLQCIGSDTYGQLAELPSFGFQDLALYLGTICGLADDGQVYCWGRDTKGETEAPVF